MFRRGLSLSRPSLGGGELFGETDLPEKNDKMEDDGGIVGLARVDWRVKRVGRREDDGEEAADIGSVGSFVGEGKSVRFTGRDSPSNQPDSFEQRFGEERLAILSL